MALKIPKDKTICTDTETTGLFPRHGDRPFFISFCNLQYQTAFTSFPVDPFTRKVAYRKETISILKDLFLDPERILIAHNAQFDKKMIEAMIEEETKCQWRCTMALIRVVKSSADLALKPFCKKYLGFPDDDEQDLHKAVARARAKGRKLGWKLAEDVRADFWMAPKECKIYGVRDVLRVAKVYNILLPEVKRLNVDSIWSREKKLWPIMRSIENRGVHIDRDRVMFMKEDFKKKLQMYELRARLRAGGQMNFNSPVQLQKKFYKDFKEPVRFLTEKAKLPATDYAALKAMRHPLAKEILEMRACQKTVDFMDQYLKFMIQHSDGHWYLHPEFSQSIPKTGRESCYLPNLQQVASGESMKAMDVKPEARTPFTPRPGYRMRSYDWKNIEVFIPAFASGEKRLTKILLAGGDVHQNTADSIPSLKGKPSGRYMAKRVFFGLQYGMGIELLAKLLGISEDEASEMWVGFQDTYPTLWEWFERLKAESAVKGYLTTPYGRREEIDPGYEYRAINYYVQGTAADILKSAKVKIYKEILRRKWNVHIVLPIHDEILPEIELGMDVEEVDRMIVGCMQDNPELKMPIPIPVSISDIRTNWADKEKVKVVS